MFIKEQKKREANIFANIYCVCKKKNYMRFVVNLVRLASLHCIKFVLYSHDQCDVSSFLGILMVQIFVYLLGPIFFFVILFLCAIILIWQLSVWMHFGYTHIIAMNAMKPFHGGRDVITFVGCTSLPLSLFQSLLSLLFKLSYHSQVLLLKTLFSLLLILLYSLQIIHWHMLFSHVNHSQRTSKCLSEWNLIRAKKKHTPNLWAKYLCEILSTKKISSLFSRLG